MRVRVNEGGTKMITTRYIDLKSCTKIRTFPHQTIPPQIFPYTFSHLGNSPTPNIPHPRHFTSWTTPLPFCIQAGQLSCLIKMIITKAPYSKTNSRMKCSSLENTASTDIHRLFTICLQIICNKQHQQRQQQHVSSDVGGSVGQ